MPAGEWHRRVKARGLERAREIARRKAAGEHYAALAAELGISVARLYVLIARARKEQHR